MDSQTVESDGMATDRGLKNSKQSRERGTIPHGTLVTGRTDHVEARASLAPYWTERSTGWQLAVAAHWLSLGTGNSNTTPSGARGENQEGSMGVFDDGAAARYPPVWGPRRLFSRSACPSVVRWFRFRWCGSVLDWWLVSSSSI